MKHASPLFLQRFFTIALCSVLGIASLSASVFAGEPNTLTEFEKKSGWELLFDGKSTEGWRNYQKETISDGWVVADGALTRLPRKKGEKGYAKAGNIISTKQYESFDLSLEYKISKGGNSGVIFHVQETEKQPWQTGPEIQIFDNAANAEPKGQLAGYLYGLYQPKKPSWQLKREKASGKVAPPLDATRPAGEWNQLFIRISPQQSEVIVNGYRYYRFKKGSKDWDKRVAASKFSKYANFGKPTKGHLCLQDHNDEVAFRNIKVRKLKEGRALIEPSETDTTLKSVIAFPKLNWDQWQPISEKGKLQEFRPIVITHANDGSNRLFVASQKGRIYHFKNDPNVEKSTLFLDLTNKIQDYKARGANEEGLLGFCMHPKFKTNGKFYLYYTLKDPAHTSVISEFQTSKTDPTKADPASERVILKLEQPFPNHNGGTIAFGKEGYLYIAFGDGGAGNDPFGNAQNLTNWFGSILRIDIDRQCDGKEYHVPKDNPYVGKKDVRPEIYAHGFRNIWRFSFDRKTGKMWEADVGQSLFEEINIVKAGGNYGWNKREGNHPFGAVAAKKGETFVNPIWEYDHGIGKSITGGNVYRGKKLPMLEGAYLYADYVSGRVWALKNADCPTHKAVNISIPTDKMPVLTFGEDEQGEVYFSTVQPNGRGIHKLISTK